MRAEGFSTYGFSLLMRSSNQSLQAQLAKAQVELSTGRHFDSGLALREETGVIIDWRSELDELGRMEGRIELGAARAQAAQAALTSVTSMIGSIISTLTGARGAAEGPSLAGAAADTALSNLTSHLNAAFAGQFLFGGLNSGQAPITSFDGSPAQQQLRALFLSEFGFEITDPLASGITAADMAAFADAPLNTLFTEASWQGSWSSASDERLHIRISDELTVEPSVTANEAGFRNIAQALAMVSELSKSDLGQAAVAEIIDAALGLLVKGQLEIGDMQARIGVAQGQMATAIDHLDHRSAIVTASIGKAEAVDPYEVATRINGLMTQLEASYTAAGRLNQLSLLNYI